MNSAFENWYLYIHLASMEINVRAMTPLGSSLSYSLNHSDINFEFQSFPLILNLNYQYYNNIKIFSIVWVNENKCVGCCRVCGKFGFNYWHTFGPEPCWEWPLNSELVLTQIPNQKQKKYPILHWLFSCAIPHHLSW